MSNEEKQIEEMANITRVWCEIDNSCGSCHWETCNECLAECLYKAGYRKASDVAREIFAEIEKYMAPLESWFLSMKQQNQDCSEEYWGGKLSAFKQIRGYIDCDLKKKYESEDNK